MSSSPFPSLFYSSKSDKRDHCSVPSVFQLLELLCHFQVPNTNANGRSMASGYKPVMSGYIPRGPNVAKSFDIVSNVKHDLSYFCRWVYIRITHFPVFVERGMQKTPINKEHAMPEGNEPMRTHRSESECIF